MQGKSSDEALAAFTKSSFGSSVYFPTCFLNSPREDFWFLLEPEYLFSVARAEIISHVLYTWAANKAFV